MIITLSSTNPDLSFIIKKNPTGLPIVRPLRNGYLIGWYPKNIKDVPGDEFNNPQIYVIYFHDSPDACSFQMLDKGNEAKYVNGGQYCSPLIVIGAQSEILGTALGKKDDLDVSHFHTLTISGFWIKNMTIFRNLLDAFQEVQVELKHLLGHMYQVQMQYQGALYDFMSIISLISIITAMTNHEPVMMENASIEKYTKLLHRSTTNKVAHDGWYLRYIFKKRSRMTKKHLHLLDTPRIKMTYGNTSDARCDFIWYNLSNFNMDFLDIGCGTDLSIRRMIHRRWNQGASISNYGYYLVDSDPKVRERLANRGLSCHESIDDFYVNNPDFNGCMIMTEVIEHNDAEKAEEIINIALSYRPSKIMITTPNFTFNQFFSSNPETLVKRYRHDDHQWEMTFEEFQSWLSRIVDDTPYDIKFLGIGDTIDGIPITSGAILTLKYD